MAEVKWTEWEGRPEEDQHVSPYISWSIAIGGDAASIRSRLVPRFIDDPDQLVGAIALGEDAASRQLSVNPILRQSFCELDRFVQNGPPDSDAVAIAKQILTDVEEQLRERTDVSPVIPAFSRNGEFCPNDDWLRNTPEDIELDRDAVIVGVIDRGIALGHRSTRFGDGRTRMLAAWQQIADRNQHGNPTSSSAALPFGIELVTQDIDDRLAEYSDDGTAGGNLDEDAFNRSVGTDDYFHMGGHRELGRRLAHGAHVLSLAAGLNPLEEPDKAEKIRIMTVNLPERAIVGLSSRHLEFFVRLGIARIVGLADKIWDNAHADDVQNGRQRGCPIVINLSFAKQAGAKDGDDVISRYVRLLNRARAVLNRPPVYLIVPAGNDNLSRGNASVMLKDENPKTLFWRITPEDQSSNYVEVWTRGKFDADGSVINGGLAIEVTTPDGRSSPFVRGQPGQYADLKNTARIYCQSKVRIDYNYVPRDRNDDPPEPIPMIGYVICIAPTLLHEDNPPVAPVGRWRIRLINHNGEDLFVALSVQTDQSDQPESLSSIQSYFDDPCYEQFLSTGRKMDTYNYPDRGNSPYPPDEVRKDYDNYFDGDRRKPRGGFIRRHGTMNAILAFGSIPPEIEGTYIPGASVVGGYRLSDGRPADYSSSGYGPDDRVLDVDRRAPIVSLPVDRGYALQGWLGSGSREGSTVAMQGTSFATAQMTALAASLLIDNRGNTMYRLRSDIYLKAKELEECGNYIGFADPEKTGGGRLAPPTNTWIKFQS